MAVEQKIVFLDRDTLKADVKRPSFEHQWVEHASTSSDDVVDRLGGATVAITNKVPLTASALERLPNLQLIAMAATGYDVIDIDYCRRHGISVVNVRNYAARTVAEHTFALILALRRNLIAYRTDVLEGRWRRHNQFCFVDHPIRNLHGATIGVIGAGSIGQATAEIARSFGMKVLFGGDGTPRGHSGQMAPLDTVLSMADIVTLHLPLRPSTKNMIGMTELRRMKRTALLINTARGGLVDEAALCVALNEGLIAGAGIDVLTVEPPRGGNPLLELHLPNLIVTPHVAWASVEAMQELADQLIGNIEAFFNGQPRNVVA